jgi:hypothetical protein
MFGTTKSQAMREVSEVAYQELLETERKYLLLLEEHRKVVNSLEEHTDNLRSFFEKL